MSEHEERQEEHRASQLDSQISALKRQIEEYGGSQCDHYFLKALSIPEVIEKVKTWVSLNRLLTGVYLLPTTQEYPDEVNITIEFRDLPPKFSIVPCFFVVKLTSDSGRFLGIRESNSSKIE